MYETLAALIAAVIAIIVCVFAIIKGGTAERWSGFVVIAAWLASPWVQVADVHNPEWFILIIDAVVAIVFVLLLWRTKKLWLVVAAAFQLLTVASHTAMLIDLRITMNTYLMALGIWGVGVLGALLTGTMLHLRSKRSRNDADGETVSSEGD